MLFTDRYLMLIALLTIVLNIVNTSGEYIFGRFVVDTATAMHGAGEAAAEARGKFIGDAYSRFYGHVNLLGLLLQMFVVSRGVQVPRGRPRAVHPSLIAGAGYLFMLRTPSFEMIRVLKTVDNAVDYSLNNTTKQALWLPTSRRPSTRPSRRSTRSASAPATSSGRHRSYSRRARVLDDRFAILNRVLTGRLDRRRGGLTGAPPPADRRAPPPEARRAWAPGASRSPGDAATPRRSVRTHLHRHCPRILAGFSPASHRGAAARRGRLRQAAADDVLPTSCCRSSAPRRANRRRPARLGSRVGLVLLVLWAIVLAGVFCLPVMFPHIQAASFFSTTLLDDGTPFDLIDLYVPSNPFHALANNMVPAVVLFSGLLGIALIGVPGKDGAIHVIKVLNSAVAQLARFIVALTPIGLFGIAAVTAGTLDLGEAAQLQIYLACYLTVSVLLALWVLPGVVAAVTPIPHGVLLARSRDALVLAFGTGSLLVTLPLLAEQARGLLGEYADLEPRDAEMPDVIIPAAYNFPHSGKLLSIGFVLFAAWFSGASISPGALSHPGRHRRARPVRQRPTSPSRSCSTCSGFPPTRFQLYLATGVVSARFGTLLAAVHMLAIAIIARARWPASCASMRANCSGSQS
jgi:hypothetical protein